MEKKQITNSSTVSSAVKDPHGDQGWEPPSLAFLTHSSVQLLPQKGGKFVTIYNLNRSPSGPQRGFRSTQRTGQAQGHGQKGTEGFKHQSYGQGTVQTAGCLRGLLGVLVVRPHNSPFRMGSSLGVNRSSWHAGFQRTNSSSIPLPCLQDVWCGGLPQEGASGPTRAPLADKGYLAGVSFRVEREVASLSLGREETGEGADSGMVARAP